MCHYFICIDRSHRKNPSPPTVDAGVQVNSRNARNKQQNKTYKRNKNNKGKIIGL